MFKSIFKTKSVCQFQIDTLFNYILLKYMKQLFKLPNQLNSPPSYQMKPVGQCQTVQQKCHPRHPISMKNWLLTAILILPLSFLVVCLHQYVRYANQSFPLFPKSTIFNTFTKENGSKIVHYISIRFLT